MALNPYTYSGKDIHQPGARGEVFQANLPGYRDNADRINRTNTVLNINDHDVLNIKYGMDHRLPVLFKYGFAHGYNQLVIPKGRIVAVDPHLNTMDTDTLHFFNTMTLANGGKNVELDMTAAGQYGKLWKETTTPLTVDEATGYMKADGQVSLKHRAANKPIGILERNEYTRDADAYNGMMPGPVRTDAMVELPVFTTKAAAEGNPWGSIYGKDLKPGMLVKSDENGRVIPSPLSFTDKAKAQGGCSDMTIAEYEAERQQVIGTIYSTDFSLLPEGAARFAQWAIEDRLNWNDYNPHIWPNSNRRGEDVVSNPPTMYQSSMEYPGYPWDRTAMTHDLHMLASTREGMFNPRFDEKHRLDRGIPGLTDGYNAVEQEFGAVNNEPTLSIGKLNLVEAADFVAGHQTMFTLPDTDLSQAVIKIGEDKFTITGEGRDTLTGTKVDLSYVDLHKGIFAVTQKTAEAAKTTVEILCSYKKRGMAGVPTNLDWEGCKGTAKILLQL